jgi:soluble lytic murein transglycosylase
MRERQTLRPDDTLRPARASRWCGRQAALLLVAAMALLAAPAIAQTPQARPAVPDSPAPEPLPQEKAYRDKLDAALAPLLKYDLAEDEAKRIHDCVAAVQGNNLARCAEIKPSIKDAAGRKLIDWAALRAGFGEPDDYAAFVKENPLWPERALMVQRMEEALFMKGGSAENIKAHFKSAAPETGIGYAALASAYLAEGKKDEAKKYASKAWRELPVPATLETGFLQRFAELLDEKDHRWRFDRIITDDPRWAGNRTERAAIARRIVPLLSPNEQKKATARLAVFTRASNAKALMDAIPDSSESDAGLAFHREQLLRRAGKYEDAAKLILSVPPDPKKIAGLDEWWAERRDIAYGALKTGNPKLAYEVTKDAGPLTVNPLKEQTFMAGWIAFRLLKDTAAAEKHFTDFAKAADGPLSRAKSAYWLGRVAESKGDKDAAAKHYKDAAKDVDTFHGLLAMQKLDPNRHAIEITPPAFPSQETIDKLLSLDMAKALAVARKAGLGREITRPFLNALRSGLPGEPEAAIAAHLADTFGDTQMSMRIGKLAVAKQLNLITYAYPLHPFPAYKPFRPPPEIAFLLGVVRQETEFEPKTLSGAGAKGLLQVMTVTAKHVCHDYKVKCDIPRLMTDNAYNATMASAYIADRMGEFGGSYVLGLAGYNAGPGRARQWIREFGDPRDPKVDPLDWIERIPFTETREYVSKVLANIQIYRARTGQGANALRLNDDLLRARGTFKVPEGGKDEAEPGTAPGTDG